MVRRIIGIVLIVLQIVSYIGNIAAGGLNFFSDVDGFGQFMYDLVYFLSFNLVGIVGLILLILGIRSRKKGKLEKKKVETESRTKEHQYPCDVELPSECEDMLRKEYEPMSLRGKGGVSNRTLLASAVASEVQDLTEWETLQEYQRILKIIEVKQKELSKIRGEIREILSTDSTTTTADLDILRKSANEKATLINHYDHQLLELESTTALKNVLEMKKLQLLKQLEEKGKESLENYYKEKEKEVEEFIKNYDEKGQEALRTYEQNFIIKESPEVITLEHKKQKRSSRKKAHRIFAKIYNFFISHKKLFIIISISCVSLLIASLITYNVLGNQLINLRRHYEETKVCIEWLETYEYGCGMISCHYCKGTIIRSYNYGRGIYAIEKFSFISDVRTFFEGIGIMFLLLTIVCLIFWIFVFVYHRKCILKKNTSVGERNEVS